MHLNDLIESSLQSLARTKARSALTMLGIVIGITSVILVLSIGEAAQRYILAQISAFGSDVLFIANGSTADQNQPSLFIKQTLTVKDVRKLQTYPWVSMITGLVQQSDHLTANGLDTNVQVIGTMPDETRINDLKLASGAFFGNSSVDGRSREVVLGHEIASSAFGAEDPIGKSIKLSKVSFKVVGVMEASGSKGFQNVDKQVYIPVTAALDLYSLRYLTSITMRTTLPLEDAKDRIRVTLRDLHNLDNPEGDVARDDFNVKTQEDLVKSASTITSILQILLISIAAISLLVGGIGIMNIMYVTVTERTREIGLRKSIGALPGDILSQFLVEAIVQTMIGGAIGTVLGVTFSWIAIQIISRLQEGWSFGVSNYGIILGFGVSAAIGIVFGYFPARRAAKLNPIDALRFE